jgi:uncharacterized protein YdhG (YjbR/CyaY superfamily)
LALRFEMTEAGFSSIDEYIQSCPESVRKMLQDIRATIHNAVPEAEETISYSMPAFRLKGLLLYFSACKSHIGVYPTSSGIEAFKPELASFKHAKGSVQFPLDRPMPLDLIAKIAKFRAKEDLGNFLRKKAAKEGKG